MAVKRFREMQIIDVMRRDIDYSIFTVNATAQVAEVAQKLEENPSDIVVVIDKNNVPQGIVTQTDMIKIFQSGKPVDPSTTVEEIMTGNVITIHEERTVDEALSIMRSLNVNKLVVIDEERKFRGFIHKLDIIRESRQLL